MSKLCNEMLCYHFAVNSIKIGISVQVCERKFAEAFAA
jgi:hypothetical protein